MLFCYVIITKKCYDSKNFTISANEMRANFSLHMFFYIKCIYNILVYFIILKYFIFKVCELLISFINFIYLDSVLCGITVKN